MHWIPNNDNGLSDCLYGSCLSYCYEREHPGRFLVLVVVVYEIIVLFNDKCIIVNTSCIEDCYLRIITLRKSMNKVLILYS